ncbi:MAG: response regulator [Deltaproteobacteria bacterium]|jgi:two-component system response regulator NreC
MLSILIVEDSVILRKRIKKILLSKLPSLNIAEASNENNVFSEIRKNRPALVIMDIRLAGNNGLNLTKKIKDRYPLIPVAIHTNHDSAEYKIAAAQVGADYFLSKKSNTIIDLVSLAQSVYLRRSGKKG